MKNNIPFITIFLLLLTSLIFSGTVILYDEPIITSEEINILSGEKWKGNLTYLDYESGFETTISADITVIRSEENELKFIFQTEFPKEPHANSTDTISVSEDGKFFYMEEVIDKIIFAGDSLKFITESSGMDDDKEALFRHTYGISKNIFSIRKDVKYTGDTVFIKRNEYYFIR